MNCPGCDKEGPYTEENGYEILGWDECGGLYECEDCGETVAWP